MTHRLPPMLREIGEIVLTRPVTPGTLAHRRLDVRTGTDPRTRQARYTTTIACQPPTDTDPIRPGVQMSAGWAEHAYQATACPTCFPEATT
jgi:hypothetical protein